MFLEDEPAEAPEGEERVRALEAECARLREELATVSKELASKVCAASEAPASGPPGTGSARRSGAAPAVGGGAGRCALTRPRPRRAPAPACAAPFAAPGFPQTLQLSKRDQADRTSHEKWAQERATQLAATAGLDKDARIVALENSVRQLEATLAERAEVCGRARAGVVHAHAGACSA